MFPEPTAIDGYNALEAESTSPLSERTIADALKAAGYKSYILGKYHLGGHTKQHLLQRGFDHFFLDFWRAGTDILPASCARVPSRAARGLRQKASRIQAIDKPKAPN